jgi:16S rRNA A1518/A1519 N6-dimethyltransferase RsmA/KsgA/DIM1 with predicted DNA glycosylase/AP lyase activity
MEYHYNWNPEKYIKVIEKTDDPIFQDYMKTEIEYIIKNVENPSNKTFIDVGAGYGRVVHWLSKIGKNVIAVEIDKKMLKELKKRSKKLSNVIVIEGDANELTRILSKYNYLIENPVLISLQNTFGTLIGNPYKVLEEMKKIATMKKEK